jgi:death-on-curing protein
MQEPNWVLDETVLAIHNRQIAEHGGLSGVRDAGALASALGRPKNKFAYAEPDIFDLAAAYGFGIATNHPFADGNKRTAYVVSVLFLALNGYRVEASQDEKYRTFLDLAAGNLAEESLAAWFRAHCLPITS